MYFSFISLDVSSKLGCGSRLRFGVLPIVMLFLAAVGHSQQSTPTPETDVVRIEAALAQATVTVVDRKGRAVEGLKKDDFSLQVDGKPVPIEFFEGIVTGSTRDRALRTRDPRTPTVDVPRSESSTPPRTIAFYVDDHHLSLTGVERTRAAILDFIDNQMGPEDQAAIASPSGRVGFLQQFTDNKEVLRAAVKRLGVVGMTTTDYGANPGAPMTEYNALSIEKQDDPGLFDFYVQNCIVNAPRGFDPQQRRAMRDRCEVEVRNRARQMIIEAGVITDGTYSAFEKLLESAARMPSRKLAFFFSDGFLADTGPRGRGSHSKLVDIIARAKAASVVVYTIDSRGLVSGSLDATGSVPFDPDGRLESAQLRAILASQDALHAIAADTGGRALRNQNSFDEFINSAIDETSRFYVISWRPDEGADRKNKLRNVEITIPGRTDLTILAGHNIITSTSTAASPVPTKVDPKKSGGPDADLKAALADYLGGGAFPVFMSLNWVDAPAKGPLLTASIELPASAISFGSSGRESGQVTLAGGVLDDRGKPAASFGTGLKIAPRAGAGDTSKIVYNHPNAIKPGLYQVRLAARDDKSGSIGSSNAWILIPDLASGELALSSVFVESIDTRSTSSRNTSAVQWSVDKIVGPGATLNILAFVYNAGASADVEARTVVYRGKQVIAATQFEGVASDVSGDPRRIGISKRVKLEGLAPGRYTLGLNVRDRGKKKEVTRSVNFSIE